MRIKILKAGIYDQGLLKKHAQYKNVRQSGPLKNGETRTMLYK